MWTIPMIAHSSTQLDVSIKDREHKAKVYEHSQSLPCQSQYEKDREHANQAMVTELFAAMRELSNQGVGLNNDNGSTLSLGSVTSNISFSSSPPATPFSPDSMASSLSFEVLLIGKIKVSHCRPPSTFIDDALEKLIAHDDERRKLREVLHRPDVVEDKSRGILKKLDKENLVDKNHLSTPLPPPLRRNLSDSSFPVCCADDENSLFSDKDHSVVGKKNVNFVGDDDKGFHRLRAGSGDFTLKQFNRLVLSKPSVNSDCLAPKSHEPNRTMLFQIGKTDLCLICPEKKSTILHKLFVDISYCSQGQKKNDHFGFICREPPPNGYVGYIFRCQSQSVVDQILLALKQSFHTAMEAQLNNKNGFSLAWFQKLHQDIEGLPPQKTHTVILKYLDLLREDERSVILAKFHGAHTSGIAQQNELLIMLIKAHCELKMNRSNQELASGDSHAEEKMSSALFMKAKRSLAQSFDQFLKRKDHRQHPAGENPEPPNLKLQPTPAAESFQPIESKHHSKETSGDDAFAPQTRARSSTVGTAGGDHMKKELRLKGQISKQLSESSKHNSSEMMNIFMKVGNPPKSSEQASPEHSSLKPTLRVSIFNRVQTPPQNKHQASSPHAVSARYRSHHQNQVPPVKKRTREELRGLWRKAIMQQILVLKMEKENKRICEYQEEASQKRIKLDYDEITLPGDQEAAYYCDMLIYRSDRLEKKFSKDLISEVLRKGIPKLKRGDMWSLLVDQNRISVPKDSMAHVDGWDVPYENLLADLTSYQHSILLDLGRTFPSHKYYEKPLGPGQLSLFNILKAYSLLDEEVGYCQGLSFVAAILLLHMQEKDAFDSLKHLLYELGLRQQYKPDMVALQIQMYQLSRLLHDQLNKVYHHLDQMEIAPSLYAAPWFLTLFASQFSIGFVVRVFDMLFLYGIEAIFRVAICLLRRHEDEILKCDNLEAVMHYFKSVMPNVGPAQAYGLLNDAYRLNISRELQAYEVEYHVLQEEMINSPKISNQELDNLKTSYNNLKRQNLEILERLQNEHTKILRLEADLGNSQKIITRLQSKNFDLEKQCSHLSMALSIIMRQIPMNLNDLKLPSDLRRLVHEKMGYDSQDSESSVLDDNSFSDSPGNASLTSSPSENTSVLSRPTFTLFLEDESGPSELCHLGKTTSQAPYKSDKAQLHPFDVVPSRNKRSLSNHS